MLPNYTLGSTEPEHRRLIQLASFEEDRVVDACRRAQVSKGASALDLGCGPLGALAALAGFVGHRGTVIGIDASRAALEKAGTLLSHEAFAHVRFLEADVNDVTLQQLDIGPVDLVYCRLLLLHQTDPARTLRNAATLLRPEGVLIAHEPSDLAAHAPASEPHVPAMTRVWELVIGAAQARGASTDFGRKGKQYLERAGFAVESHRSYAVHYPPDIGYEIPRVALQSLRPAIAQHGLASEAEVARLNQELEVAKRAATIDWVSSPLMFEWIARKR